MRIIKTVLPYTKSSGGKYRDLRQIEFQFPYRGWFRFSLNGIYPTNGFRILRYKGIATHVSCGLFNRSITFSFYNGNWKYKND